MQVIEPGNLHKRWEITHRCDECSALLKIELHDLRYRSPSYHLWSLREESVMFKCADCNKVNHLKSDYWPALANKRVTPVTQAWIDGKYIIRDSDYEK